MKYSVYHDDDSRTIVISGITTFFPEASLTVVYLGGDNIAIRHRTAGWNVLGPISYERIVRQSGAGFSDVGDCVQYLETELDIRHSAAVAEWTVQEW